MGGLLDLWQQVVVNREAFLPHSICLSVGPVLWLSAISDGIIAISYYSIPFVLLVFAAKRQDLVFRWAFVMFGAFILACGTTHVMHIWTLFQPDYLVAVAINTVTAIISLAAAVALWPLLPRALTFPSPQQLADVNAALNREIAERQAAESVVRSSNVVLERRVEERTAELEAANQALRNEICQRQAVEMELRQAKEQAEQANLGKSKFLAAASHDLRQPIQAMFYFTQALALRLPDERSRGVLADLDRSLLVLKGLLDSLLDVSKLDAGAVTVERRDFPVNELLDRISAEFSPAAEQKGLHLTVMPSHAWVNSDPTLLGRVLQNLVANAVRYTEQGKVLVGCRRYRDSLSIEVWDTGMGIPEDRLNDIFEEFTQLDQGKHERGQGLGLGLAIVRRLCRLLDHQVTVGSRLGMGSHFKICVPLARGWQKATFAGPPAASTSQGWPSAVK